MVATNIYNSQTVNNNLFQYCYIIIKVNFVYISDKAPLWAIVISITFGIVLWSFIEYSLHRWVFHMKPSGTSKALIYIHFAIHGLHHKVNNTDVCWRYLHRIILILGSFRYTTTSISTSSCCRPCICWLQAVFLRHSWISYYLSSSWSSFR